TLGDVEPALLDLNASGGLPVVRVQAEFPVQRAANADAAVTGNAPGADERLQACPSLGFERRDITAEVRVECSGRDQCTFVSPDRKAKVCRRNGSGLVRESPLEHRQIA